LSFKQKIPFLVSVPFIFSRGELLSLHAVYLLFLVNSFALFQIRIMSSQRSRKTPSSLKRPLPLSESDEQQRNAKRQKVQEEEEEDDDVELTWRGLALVFLIRLRKLSLSLFFL
jgi:hypothetical protein